MSDLKTNFENAVTQTRSFTQRPDNASLLRLYGLYKQATQGDVSEKKPGFGDLVGRAKWDAWNHQKGSSAEAAMQAYIDLVASLA